MKKEVRGSKKRKEGRKKKLERGRKPRKQTMEVRRASYKTETNKQK